MLRIRHNMQKLGALPWYLLFAHFVSRTMIGIGAGLLMAAYVRGIDLEFGGWFNLIVGLVLGIPSTAAVFRRGRREVGEQGDD